MRTSIKRLLRQLGYEIRRLPMPPAAIGSDNRPVGQMDLLLEDLKHRGLDCRAILDVGANATTWSRMARRVFPQARSFLIEPQLEMQSHLEQFCREYDNSAFILAGAGARHESRPLTIWPDLAGSSFLPPADENLRRQGKQRDIEIVTIDDLISDSIITCPELMKLDIQGFELEALRGAERTFGATEAYILEVSLLPFSDVPGVPVFVDVIDFMSAREYVVYDFAGFLRRPLDGALGQCDICFVRKDGFLRRSKNWR